MQFITLSAKEYKGTRDSNSPTGPNEAVRVAILYYYTIYMLEKRIAEWKAPIKHPGFSIQDVFKWYNFI